jgi:hypothetical protein
MSPRAQNLAATSVCQTPVVNARLIQHEKMENSSLFLIFERRQAHPNLIASEE